MLMVREPALGDGRGVRRLGSPSAGIPVPAERVEALALQGAAGHVQHGIHAVQVVRQQG